MLKEANPIFFQVFGPGKFAYVIDPPFERFLLYERLLTNLREADPEKYGNMHKGTPFFFLSWTAFELKNYEKALFYLDAAVAEDSRANPNEGWLDLPAGQLLTLQISDPHPAVEVRKRIEKSIDEQLIVSKNITRPTF